MAGKEEGGGGGGGGRGGELPTILVVKQEYAAGTGW